MVHDLFLAFIDKNVLQKLHLNFRLHLTATLRELVLCMFSFLEASL